MSTGFAEEMESDARKFINELICKGKLDEELYDDDSNFKPWYSPRGLIDNAVGGVDRVLIGVNPGGCPGDPDQTTVDRLWEHELNPAKPFNAYLDECWDDCPKGESQLQIGVRNVFGALYRDGWDVMLRKTACFNVCPLRTSDRSKIHTDLWDQSVEWCKRVLNDLMPTVIICNGNDRETKSPWTVLKTAYGLDQIECEPLGNSKRSVKFGVATIEPLEGTKVMAVPHLSIHGQWSSLPAAVRRFRDELLSD